MRPSSVFSPEEASSSSLFAEKTENRPSTGHEYQARERRLFAIGSSPKLSLSCHLAQRLSSWEGSFALHF
jgi:hypothetical protein